MSSKLQKRISRALMVSWREQPTRYDIEALQANIRRVGLVIRVRWVLVTVLVLYSVLAGGAYASQMEILELARLMAIPAIALGFVVLYNSFYALNYRRLGNIAVWNNLQLALDAVVVTVLIYYSGGASSWFWSMYSLFILEAAFILPRSRDVWGLAGICAILLGLVEGLELIGVLPHIDIPFGDPTLYADRTYIAIRYLWQVAVLAGTAWVSTLLVGEVRRELSSRSSTILDQGTGLFSRSYVMRAFGAELRRATRDNRELHVMLIDIDRFGAFNERFGLDTGDTLLAELAKSLSSCLGEAGDLSATTNLVGRFGGEEFIVLLAEDARIPNAPTCEDALALAEEIRKTAESVRVKDAGITVSIGVSSMPEDGVTIDALLDAADAALSAAVEAGGNRVVPASECEPHSAGKA